VNSDLTTVDLRMKSKKSVKRIVAAIWMAVFLLGLYVVFHGFNVMNAQEPIGTKRVSTYVRYFNGIIAGNLTIYLTSVGPITPNKPVNTSIDLYWLYPSSPNPVFSVYFWDANPQPEFPFNATMPPPTPKIYLLNLWWMPKNHFKSLKNVTLVWMTSGVKGITIEEIETQPRPYVETYNVTGLIEVDPASAATRFREAHTSEGQWWIGIGIAIVFGSTLVYEVAEHLRKTR